MKMIVTCGPSYEPLDEVRRLTNFSTGSLGFLLSTRLSEAGFDVICLKGELSTSTEPLVASQIRTFSTNASLLGHLEELSKAGDVGAVFHVAALCDYRVTAIKGSDGRNVAAAKIPSRAGRLTLELEPAVKVISHLRPLFPKSFLVGWKYELNGTRENAVAAALAQIKQNGTDACVVNGRAFGPGFGIYSKSKQIHIVNEKKDLAQYLSKIAKYK
jgi:phosphopantothenoylcysteine decarboxylase/phosphopantothenate--cysteine ligase